MSLASRSLPTTSAPHSACRGRSSTRGGSRAGGRLGSRGKTVKPRLYLALGISGAVQHLAGMRDAETIIAINTDPEAPIFSVAHYGAIVDMFEFADELEQALRA